MSIKKKKNRGVSSSSPAKKQKLFLYTKGGEYSLNGIEYIGEYHIDNGVAKTGPLPPTLSRIVNKTGPDQIVPSKVRLTNTKNEESGKVLHKYYTNKDHYLYDKLKDFNVNVVNYKEPVPYLWKPSEVEYDNGESVRYFVEKVNDEESYAIEINQQQFDRINQFGGIDGGLYSFVSIEWKLVGSRQYVESYNEKQLYKASAIVPSIGYAVRNFIEYARLTS
jgi:lipoprotein-anchoring transpeptidase ErfK/SrfK